MQPALRAQVHRAPRGADAPPGSEIAAASSGDSGRPLARSDAPRVRDARCARILQCARDSRGARGPDHVRRRGRARRRLRGRSIASSRPATAACGRAIQYAGGIARDSPGSPLHASSNNDSTSRAAAAPDPRAPPCTSERVIRSAASRAASDRHVGSASARSRRSSGRRCPSARRSSPQDAEVDPRRRPASPLGRRHVERVLVHDARELLAADPAPAAPRIHDLEPATDASPGDDEVVRAARKTHDDDRRQHVRSPVRDVIDRHEALRGRESELARHFLERVDRRPVDVGLARLAQPSVARRGCRDPRAGTSASRAAVHRRGLHDLGREPAAPCIEARHHSPHAQRPSAACESRLLKNLPTDPSTSSAGEVRPTRISTLPGQSVLERNPRMRGVDERELDVDPAVACFAGDALDGRLRARRIATTESRRDACRRHLRLGRGRAPRPARSALRP